MLAAVATAANYFIGGFNRRETFYRRLFPWLQITDAKLLNGARFAGGFLADAKIISGGLNRAKTHFWPTQNPWIIVVNAWIP